MAFKDLEKIKNQYLPVIEKDSGIIASIKADLTNDLKNAITKFRAEADDNLQAKQDGTKCARDLSDYQDELIKLLYCLGKATLKEPADEPALVATGGYGRSLLAPHSDIDLLFLLPESGLKGHSATLDFVLYSLWDLGFKVGHAVRTVKESIASSLEDWTICTTLLDARHIAGDIDLFDRLETRFVKDVISGRSKEFIAAKLEERDKQHKSGGDTRYHVEPNMKEGKGGLRDLHLLHWLIHFTSQDRQAKRPDHLKEGLLTSSERDVFKTLEDFFWTIRCHLHFLVDKPEEKLTFGVQMGLAERLKYIERPTPVENVEHFMRDYFRAARNVGSLTRTVSLALELSHLKEKRSFFKILDAAKNVLPMMESADKQEIDLPDGFDCLQGRLNITDPEIFSSNPINMLKFFFLSDEHEVLLHPEALKHLRENLHLINADIQNSKEANAMFLSFLSNANNVERTLRKMTESGVLGRFIPTFGIIDCMMQFNMYHHFTVDEHLIKAVGVLAAIEKGKYVEEHPLSHELIEKHPEYKRILYVALLLHDIAKGRPEDHSIAGATEARELCPRLGLNEEETETVAWLVEEHLTMSTFAQNRDISDPKTIEEFSACVKNQERLDMLLVLTVCDIRAVGPGVWNGWKGELLRNLYYVTQTYFKHKKGKQARLETIQKNQSDLAQFLLSKDFAKDQIDKFIDRFYPDFWFRNSGDALNAKAKFVIRTDAEKERMSHHFYIDAFTAQTELTIYAPVYHKLLFMITGACAASGANILGADINTTKDGMVLDSFILQRSFEEDQDEERRVGRIIATLENLRDGKIKPDEVKIPTSIQDHRIEAFDVENSIIFDNKASNQHTLLEIKCLDQPGLLFTLTRVIADLNLEIDNAHIATFGEKAVDAFYVTDYAKSKITEVEHQEKIRKKILDAIKNPVECLSNAT